jgi:hypothetical protein
MTSCKLGSNIVSSKVKFLFKKIYHGDEYSFPPKNHLLKSPASPLGIDVFG